MPLIYVVEDDASIRGELVQVLERNGFETAFCETFENVIEDIQAAGPILVLLDLTLPGTDGQFVCRELRAVSEVPIIVLTSRVTEIDEVMSMTMGADDFIPKPYSSRVLVARIQALLRRATGAADRSILEHHGVTLDLSRSTATAVGGTVELTKNEMRILRCSCSGRAPSSRARTSCATCGIRTRSSTTTRLRSISTACGRRSRKSASKIIWPRIAAADTRCRRMP